MGHRSIILLFGALCAFVASNVNALGLGKITLESALNQPLKAQIELFEVRDLTKEEIKVQVASREEFDRIGIDKIYFLSDLRFKVVLNGDGSGRIHVSSNKLVREPFLNFLVQVQWPSGKLLREYTLLMDLPVFSDAPASSVQSTSGGAAPAPKKPAASSSQPAQQASQSGSYNPRSAYEAAPSRPSSSASSAVSPSYTDDQYRVRSNDTLWEIAAAVRPDGGVSIHQTMLAIQRDNPQAFINNNINLLKSGQILRIPDRERIADIARREAVREVAVQNAAWSNDEPVSGAQLSGVRASASSSNDVSAPEGRLKLTSPDEVYGSAEGRTSGVSADASTEALENELAITMEQLDKSSRENSDLRSKVESLEEQIKTMERMLEVSNDSLRSLELAAKKNAEEAEQVAEADITEAPLDGMAEEVGAEQETPAAEAPDTSVADEFALNEKASTDELEAAPVEGSSDDVAVEGANEDAAALEAMTEEAEATPEATPVPDRKKVVITPPAPEKGFVDILLENILYIVAGVVVVAGGVFFLMRQKSSDEEDFDDFLQQHGMDDGAEQSEGEGAGFDEPQDFAEGEEPVDAIENEDSESVEASDDQEDDAPEAQTEDVVTEADIYIAYGRYDRAEEMLLNALATSPNDEDVRLKLLEVYSSQDDAERFDPHYAKLRAFASPSVIERAETLRESIAHAPEFDEDGFDVSDVAAFAGDGEARSEDDITAAQNTESADDELEDFDTDLSMDLELPEDDAASDASEVSLDIDFDSGDDDVVADDEALSLDFDLGDLDSDGDPDAGLELDLPEEGDADTNDALSFDMSDEVENSASDSGDELDLDFDLDTPETADTSSDTSAEVESLATDDLDSDEIAIGFDIDTDTSASDEDFSDLDLDLGEEDKGADLGDSLEADLASLDADLDFTLEDGDEASDEDATTITERPEELSGDDLGSTEDLALDGADSPELDMGDFDLGELDLDETADSTQSGDVDDTEALDLDGASVPDFDLEDDLGGIDDSELDLGSSDDAPSVSSDTVVNEALNDEYIEQKLSEDADLDLDLGEPLPLEDEVPASELAPEGAADLSAEDEDADLDLSSLDQELDALTSDVDTEQSSGDELPTMDEPVTDFDDFEDDLEKDEAMAETVKSEHVAEKSVEDMGEDTMFDQAIQEVPKAEGDDADFELPEVNPDDMGDDDLDFLSDSDETATKLDLARAYIDMGDQEGARDIIREVMEEGNDQQKTEAEGLLARLEAS